MNDVIEAPKAGSNIVALVEATPAVVLTDKRKFSEFYEGMKAECDAHVPDLTTEKGRKAIASLAYKVARTKTAIDEAGKALNEDARALINAGGPWVEQVLASSLTNSRMKCANPSPTGKTPRKPARHRSIR